MSDEKDDPIAKALDINPMVLPPTANIVKSPDYKDDFEYARGNMINIIEKGSEALDGIMDVAGQSQHPRSYEVVATIIKTIADANKDLMELSKRRKELEQADPDSGPKTINNNLFVGSTAELQKLLKQNDIKTK